jgi:biotin transport system substrate-specific component
MLKRVQHDKHKDIDCGSEAAMTHRRENMNSTINKNSPLQMMILSALFAAVISVGSIISIPIGEVPISLASMMVALAAVVLGPKYGSVSVIVFILLGAVGVPVFAGFEAGFGVLAGPTGGYIFGYIADAFLVGILIGKSKEIHPARLVIALVVGTIVLYAIGTAWFMAVTNMTLAAALVLCVLPFLLGDAAKLAIVFFTGRVLRRRLA